MSIRIYYLCQSRGSCVEGVGATTLHICINIRYLSDNDIRLGTGG